MSMTAEHVREAFHQLPATEQKQLAQEFWEATESEFQLTEEQKQVILDELEAYKRNPEDVITWDELKAELLGQVKP